jgi:hypothetical protein
MDLTMGLKIMKIPRRNGDESAVGGCESMWDFEDLRTSGARLYLS